MTLRAGGDLIVVHRRRGIMTSATEEGEQKGRRGGKMETTEIRQLGIGRAVGEAEGVAQAA